MGRDCGEQGTHRTGNAWDRKCQVQEPHGAGNARYVRNGRHGTRTETA